MSSKKAEALSSAPVFEPLEDRLLLSSYTIQDLAAFSGANGSSPQAGLIMDAGGNLYGTTYAGGANSDGAVFEVASGTGTVTTLASFNGANGSHPEAGLIMDGGGNLYGTTSLGGANGCGTVFEVAKGSGAITVLATFAQGSNPGVSLIMDGSGNLYGTEVAGGANGDGAVFELANGSGAITTLASFNGANGKNPEGGLMMDASGNLYGAASAGGDANGDGTVFEVTKGSGSTWTLSALALFNVADGSDPQGGLIMDGGGNLYGTAGGGGATGDGTVFELAKGSGAITALASFNGTDGSEPLCTLAMDGSEDLYGTASTVGADGDGTVFEVVNGGGAWTLTTLASFSGANGSNPKGCLIMDPSGNLYGTASAGGDANGDGAVFELVNNNGNGGSSAIVPVATFNGTNGGGCSTALIMDADGNLYGTSPQGGNNGSGTVFEVAEGTGAITILASFNSGQSPNPGLVMDGSGNLYGTATGGTNGDGTVFEVAAGSGTVTTLASFNGTNGLCPLGGLTMDRGGNLYGATEEGGASSLGTVFEVANGSGTITTLASFDGTHGSYPQGSLIMDGSGNLYGATMFGGANNDGIVFEVAKGSGAITTLGSFNGANGQNPSSGLVMDGSGNLYGTASSGGANGDGTVVELAKGSHTITTLGSFTGANGSSPAGGLVVDGSGNLYGAANWGGAGSDGTLFEVVKGSGSITMLAAFSGANGSLPQGNLILDAGGNLYGTAYSGGPNGDGNVFERSTQTILAPNTPTNTSPADGTVGVSPSPTLTASAFSDLTAGQTELAAEWVIKSGSTVVWDSGTDTTDLTSCTVPLVGLTSYTWEVRYENSACSWSAYSKPTGFTTEAGSVYGPLFTFAPWNQNGTISGSTTWNEYCPLDPKTGGRSVTGCVATAEAQVLNYWQTPTSLSFSSADSYTCEGIDIDADSSTDDFPSFAQLNADLASITYPLTPDDEALLSFVVGVKDQMGYTSSGSGTSLLATNLAAFGFESADQDPLNQGQDLDWDTIEPTVISNIEAGQPVLIGTGPHAMVIDGYNSTNDTFHVDLGWGPGYDNQNGAEDWFTLPALAGVGVGSVEEVIYNIEPTLPAPTGVTASNGAYSNHVQLTWTAAPEATGYAVWRSTSDDPSTATRISGTLTGTSYSDTTADGNQPYSYWVQSLSQIGGSSLGDSVQGSRTETVPAVTAVSPNKGPLAGGTTVTIEGTNLGGAAAVDFGTNPATIVSDTATQIVATAPAGTGMVDVTVTTVDGTSAVVTADEYTYLAPPTVTSLTPTQGPLTGGTPVTIAGTNLLGATAVDFGTTAGDIVSDTATQIVATAPAGTGTVDVTVVTAGGTSATSSNDQFVYTSPPVVTGISPNAGPLGAGATVTITGANLGSPTGVYFGITKAIVVTSTAGQIVVTAPAGTAGTVYVVVTTPQGMSTSSSADQYTYVPAPTITSVSPTKGSLAGGTTVTITGTNLANAAAVTFGSASATIVSDTATAIVATSPLGTGTVDITVTTPGGPSATAPVDKFTYVPVPIVTGIGPIAGSRAGGVSVTITGSNLQNATGVKFGTASAIITTDTAGQIVATAPAGLAGTVDVTVTTGNGSSATSVADKFTYVAAPAITGLSATRGPLTPVASVTITGTNLAGATAVKFGTKTTPITSNTGTQIVVTPPAGTAGPVYVTVTTPYGGSTTSVADQFTYVAAPAITGLSPNNGPVAGGTKVTIAGANLAGATVSFGGTPASSIVSDTATQIVVTAPGGLAGTVDVAVTTVGGVSGGVTADKFTYVAAPVVASLSPAAGPLAAGTKVTITGSNLLGATAVVFGTRTASIVSGSDTAASIQVTAPAGVAGSVHVTVTTAGGVSTLSLTDQFTYIAAPTVTSLSANRGPLGAGTSVTITGTNLTGATAVKFGTVLATGLTVNSATSITVAAPAHAVGAAAVTVTTAGGTSATSTAGQFTYVAAPTVTGITPAQGPLTVGTKVTIAGTNLLNATAVDFGGTAGRIVSNTATQIVVTAPADGEAEKADVTVTTVGGKSKVVPADQFTYTAAPAVTSLSATAGPLAAGTKVTITGMALAGVTAVKFGTAAATIVSGSNTATSIQVTAPAGTAGSVNVTVTTVGGTSASVAGDLYTYTVAPAVIRISPTTGPKAGGTQVTITGTNLQGATVVKFGTVVVNAASFVSATATQIVVDSPVASVAGSVAVTVAAAGGVSKTLSADLFTYA